MKFVAIAALLTVSGVCYHGVVAADVPLLSDGKTVATLHTPNGWTSIQNEGKTTIVTPTHAPHIQVWVAKDAADVAAAEAAVARLIASEVKDFVPTKTESLTIAGGSAKRLTGKGTEADDGDPSNAEVTIFQIGSQVVICVSHGEGHGTTEISPTLAGILAGMSVSP